MQKEFTMNKVKRGPSKTTRYCYICKAEVEIKDSMKAHQDEKHKDDIANIKIRSNMEDVVRSLCKVKDNGGQVCGARIKVTDMRNHTKKVHQMTITEYKKEYNQHYYDLVELIMHKCAICEEYVLLDSDYIAHHLKSKFPIPHDITHGNYNAQHMKLMGPSSTPKNPKTLTMRGIIPASKAQEIKKPTGSSSSTTVLKETNTRKKPPGPIPNKPKSAEPPKQNVPLSGKVTERSDGELFLQEPDPSVTVGSFRALLDSLSEDGEHLRFPDLEMILNLNI